MDFPSFYDLSAWAAPLIIAITLHEAAHGWMARRFGDDTAWRAGRVTFNPLRHIDAFGTVILPLLLAFARSPILFGYAKPVPVDFARLHPHRLGSVAVALAGPGCNLLLAVLSGALLWVESRFSPGAAPWLYLALYRSLLVNAVLMLFNLLPILPLDGGRVVHALLPPGPAKALYARVEPYGVIVVLALLVFGPALLGIDLGALLIGRPAEWLTGVILSLGDHVGGRTGIF